MGIKRTIEIDGKPVQFKTSAAIPIIYRIISGRDLMKDMFKLQANFEKAENKENELGVEDFRLFEDMAYSMAKHADGSIPEKEEWFEQFNTFSIYQVLPEIFALWTEGQKQEVKNKKKYKKPQEK